MDRGLIITADDFGLWPSYDAGMLEAVEAGVLDAVSVMVLRIETAPAALRLWGGAVGLHLERRDAGRLDRGEVERQLELFARVVGRPADYLDGHHHCHAAGEVASDVAALAAELDLPVRSVSDEHRGLLRAGGVRTPDWFIGRYEESQAVLPSELESLSPGYTEWMVHPGRQDSRSSSDYDRGREEDLDTLLSFDRPGEIARCDHRDLPERGLPAN